MGFVNSLDNVNFANFSVSNDYFTLPRNTFSFNSNPIFNFDLTNSGVGLSFLADNSYNYNPVPVYNTGTFSSLPETGGSESGSVFGGLISKLKQLTTSKGKTVSLMNSPATSFTPTLTGNKPTLGNLTRGSQAGSLSPLSLSKKELSAYGFDTREKQDAFRHLTPEMQRAVVKLTDYAKSQGIKITYSSKRSIFRTRAEQVNIYKNSRPGFAATPGYSRHESGEAVDITIPGADKDNKNDPKYKKLAAYWQSMGYTWGGKWQHCEPWHFDLRKHA